MRNFARLILYYSLTFIIIFAAVTGLKYLSLQVDWAKNLPPKPETPLTLLIASANWALALTLFLSIILTINYIVRRGFFPLVSILSVMVLSIVFCYGISHALNLMKSVPSAQVMPAAEPRRDGDSSAAGVQLSEKGLILSNSLSRNVTSIILLEGTANPYGPRVTAIPGQPLTFIEPANPAQMPRLSDTELKLPPIPFVDDTPWFLKSLDIDIRLNAEMFQQKFSEGILSYLMYVGSFIFILCSLGYLLKFSAWPLANLFLAMIVFRGIISLGTFLNAQEIQDVIGIFLNNKFLTSLAIPILFTGFGILVYIYTMLTTAAKRKPGNDD